MSNKRTFPLKQGKHGFHYDMVEKVLIANPYAQFPGLNGAGDKNYCIVVKVPKSFDIVIIMAKSYFNLNPFRSYLNSFIGQSLRLYWFELKTILTL